jgi:hypothetical protein
MYVVLKVLYIVLRVLHVVLKVLYVVLKVLYVVLRVLYVVLKVLYVVFVESDVFVALCCLLCRKIVKRCKIDTPKTQIMAAHFPDLI